MCWPCYCPIRGFGCWPVTRHTRENLRLICEKSVSGLKIGSIQMSARRSVKLALEGRGWLAKPSELAAHEAVWWEKYGVYSKRFESRGFWKKTHPWAGWLYFVFSSSIHFPSWKTQGWRSQDAALSRLQVGRARGVSRELPSSEGFSKRWTHIRWWRMLNLWYV